jgi:hypothetical protein
MFQNNLSGGGHFFAIEHKVDLIHAGRAITQAQSVVAGRRAASHARKRFRGRAMGIRGLTIPSHSPEKSRCAECARNRGAAR